MNERDAFIRAIIANPEDDAPRLVFADWLEENGEPEFADFIRVQCEVDPIRKDYGSERANELRRRQNELCGCVEQQVAKLKRAFGNDWVNVGVTVRRGFVYCLEGAVCDILSRMGRIRRACPTLRRIKLFCVNEFAAQLAACKDLRGLPELELACWYTPEEAARLAASPHLRDLETLVIWLGGKSRAGAIDPVELVRLFTSAPAWPNLRELTLIDPESRPESDQLARLADKVARRPLARVVRPRDGRLAFAPDFSYFCPGRLPDGRRMVAKPIRDQIHVVIFGDDDRVAEEYAIPQTNEVRAFVASERSLYGAHPAFREAIHRAVGSVPAFIRVFPFRWPDDWDNPVDGPEYFADRWELLGVPDDPDRPDVGHDLYGCGGEISWIVESGQFGCNVGWCDESGEVQST